MTGRAAAGSVAVAGAVVVDIFLCVGGVAVAEGDVTVAVGGVAVAVMR